MEKLIGSLILLPLDTTFYSLGVDSGRMHMYLLLGIS